MLELMEAGSNFRQIAVTQVFWLACLLVAGSIWFAPPALAGAAASRFGSDDTAFHRGPASPTGSTYSAEVVDLASARGGKMVAAVLLSDQGESEYVSAAVFRSDGSIDRSFGRQGFARTAPSTSAGPSFLPGVVEAAAVQRDGKILLAGYRPLGGEEGRRIPILIRLLPDGSLDPGFGRDGVVIPRRERGFGEWYSSVAVGPSGRIIVSGAVTQTAGTQPPGARDPVSLVRAFGPNGHIDRAFGSAGTASIVDPHTGFYYSGFSSVQVLPSGDLLASGYSRYRLRLEKLTADGRPVRSFGEGGTVTFGEEYSDCLYVCEWPSSFYLRDGRIVVQANLGDLGQTRPAALRFTADGRLDKSFGHGGVFWEGDGGEAIVGSEDIAPVGGGRSVVVGSGVDYGSDGAGEGLAVAGLTRGGLRDPRFGNRHGFYDLGRGTGGTGATALARHGGSVVVGGETSFRLHGDRKSEPGLLTLIRLPGGNDRPKKTN